MDVADDKTEPVSQEEATTNTTTEQQPATMDEGVKSGGAGSDTESKKTVTKGLGDVVEAVAKVTGIKKIVDFFTPEGEDCGCEARKEKLNKLFPIQKAECLTEDEYQYLGDFFPWWDKQNHIPVSHDRMLKVWQIHLRVFGKYKQRPGACSPCWKTIVKELRQMFTLYQNEINEQIKK